jgi:hypothetical protein
MFCRIVSILGLVAWCLTLGFGLVLSYWATLAWMYDTDFDTLWSSPWWMLIVYIPVVSVGTLICLFLRFRLGLASAAISMLVIAIRYDSGTICQDLYTAGFYAYTFPASRYAAQHCHPIEFLQAGKIYQFGVCDLYLDPDGQMSFEGEIIYDTSGDTEKYSETASRYPKAYVDAVRKFFHDDPNEAFDVADFQAAPIYGGFYMVNFIPENAAGFTGEYGPPPSDKMNIFKPIF